MKTVVFWNFLNKAFLFLVIRSVCIVRGGRVRVQLYLFHCSLTDAAIRCLSPGCLEAELTVHMLQWVKMLWNLFFNELWRKLLVFPGTGEKGCRSISSHMFELYLCCKVCSYHQLNVAAGFQPVPGDEETSLVREQCQAQFLWFFSM